LGLEDTTVAKASDAGVAKHLSAANAPEPNSQNSKVYVMSAENIRLKEILTSPEAKGRKALAEHLSFSTDMSAADARALLAIAPVDAATASRRSLTDFNTSQSQSATSAEDQTAAPWSAVADQLNKEMKAQKPGFVAPLLSH